MKIENRKVASFAIFGLLGVALVGAPVKVAAQSPVSNAAPVKKTGSVAAGQSPVSIAAPEKKTGYFEDWTSHRLIFSNPGEESQAMQNPLDYARWLQIQSDPRYLMQQVRRIGRQPQVSLLNSEGSLENSVNIHLPNSPSLQLIKGLSNPEISSFPAARRKVNTTIATDWSMGLDGSQATANVTVAGTLTNSNITSATTLTIAGTQFNASAPTAASQTGNFSAFPTSSGGNAIAVKIGSNTLNLSTNATAASSTATFTGPAHANTSISFTSGGNTLTMTPAGTGATAAGTFTAVPGVTSNSIIITSGTNTLTMTPAGAAGTVAATFSTVPAKTTSGITITNGGNVVLNMSPGGTGQTAAATFTAVRALTTNPMTITSGSSTLTMTPGGTAQTAAATFTAVPATSTTMTITNGASVLTVSTGGSAQKSAATFTSVLQTTTSPITITNGSNALTLKPGGTAQTVTATFDSTSPFGALTSAITITAAGATTTLTPTGVGTETFSAEPSNGDQTKIGTVTYVWESNCSGSGNCINRGATLSTDASNLASAIGGTCGTFSSSCNTQTGIAATSSGISSAAVTTITNTSGSSVGFSLPTNAAGNAVTPSTITTATTTACSGSGSTYSGSFIGSATASTEATNVIGIVGSNCIPITAASGGTGIVVFTDAAPGLAATVGTMADSGNVTNAITWTGPTTGANLVTATCSGSAGTFVNSATADTLATNFYDALTTGSCAATYGYSVANPGGSSAIVTLTDLYPGAAGSVGIFSGANGNGVTWTPTVGTDLGAASCSGSTGFFINSNVAATLATNFYNAVSISACATAFGYSVPSPGGGNTVTLTDLAPGASATIGAAFSGASGNGVTWNNTAGLDLATPTCSGTSGTFKNSNAAATLATNFYNAVSISACATTYGYSVPSPGGGTTVTLTDLAPGLAATVGAFTGANGNGVSWSHVDGTDLATATCTGSGPYTGTFKNSNVANTLASNFYAALSAGTCAANVGYSVPNPVGATVTLTDLSPGISFAGTGGSGVVTWTNSTLNAGSASCGGGTAPAYTGQYVNSNVANTLATDFYNAIILSSCPATVGFTTTSPGAGAVVTITDLTPGSAVNTFTGAGGAGVGWVNTAGTPGSASCSGTTGQFVNSVTVGTLGDNFSAALNTGTCPATVGFTTTHTGGTAAVTVTDTSLGANTFSAANNTSIFSWSAASSGSNGLYGCSGSAPTFTATYALGSSTTNLATNLSSAIATCNAATMGITSTSSLGQVTVTSSTAGMGGNTGSLLTSNSSPYFAWTASSLAGGADGVTDGTATPPTFAYWSVNSYVSGTTLAANVAAAVAANATMQGIGGVTAVPGTSGPNGTIALVSRKTGAAFALASGSPTPFSTLTVTGGTATTGLVQPNAYPALFGAADTASCSDYIVYPTGQAGSGTAPSIIAYTNLYESCSGNGPVPSVYWAYNPTSGYSVTTSPVISDDGTAVAFVESNGTNAKLVVIAMQTTASGSVSSAATPAAAPGNDITSCSSLPCMAVTSLSNDDTYSSPFYIYSYDTFVVGDDAGDLEVSTGAFNEAAPASATAVNLGHAVPLASPVFDQTSGCIFVGDTTGFFYSVNSGISGSVCTGSTITVKATSSQLGNAANEGIFDAPIVDSTNQTVYAFVAGSAAFSGSSCTTANWNCIAQFSTGFASATHGTTNAHIGTGGAGYNLYSGDFDNVYYVSGPGHGNLWIMGNTLGATGSFGGYLYRVSIGSAGALGAVTTVAAGLTDATTGHEVWSSPMTEFCSGTCTSDGTITTGSGSVDYMFFSVDRLTTATGTCGTGSGNGCILAYTITTPTAPSNSGALGVTTMATPGCYSTGGLVIDNSDTTTQGASNVYFIGLNGAYAGGPNGKSASGCTGVTTAPVLATQAAQSGL